MMIGKKQTLNKKLYEKSIPTAFHGDLQPENILYNSNDDKFTLIDWREGFGNNKEIGDIYYDLSKLYHALLINGNSVLKSMYDYIAIIAGILIICIFIYILISDGWKILKHIIKKYLSR